MWGLKQVYCVLPVLVVLVQLWSNSLTKQGQPEKKTTEGVLFS